MRSSSTTFTKLTKLSSLNTCECYGANLGSRYRISLVHIYSSERPRNCSAVAKAKISCI
jgi:hypothetical protein